jgi:hypothetical protein
MPIEKATSARWDVPRLYDSVVDSEESDEHSEPTREREVSAEVMDAMMREDFEGEPLGTLVLASGSTSGIRPLQATMVLDGAAPPAPRDTQPDLAPLGLLAGEGSDEHACEVRLSIHDDEREQAEYLSDSDGALVCEPSLREALLAEHEPPPPTPPVATPRMGVTAAMPAVPAVQAMPVWAPPPPPPPEPPRSFQQVVAAELERRLSDPRLLAAPAAQAAPPKARVFPQLYVGSFEQAPSDAIVLPRGMKKTSRWSVALVLLLIAAIGSAAGWFVLTGAV